MNYKTIAVALSAVALIIPAGLALAKDGGNGVFGPSGFKIVEHVQNGLNMSLRGSDDNSSTLIDRIGREDGKHRSATSTERNNEKRGELERERHATSTLAGQTASTTKSHEGFGKGGLVGFFKWFFGLPATTTVGEIRAQITATTTAGATASSSNGLGFWAHVFGFLRLGKDN